MNAAKKTVFLGILSCLFMSSVSVGVQQTTLEQQKEQLKSLVTSAFNRAFGKDNLITQRMGVEEAAIWNDTIKAIAGFVQQNGSKFTKDFSNIQSTSDNLLNTLRITFAFYIAPNVLAKYKQEGFAISPLWIKTPERFKNNIDQTIKKADWQKIDTQAIADFLSKNLKKDVTLIQNVINNLASAEQKKFFSSLNQKEYAVDQVLLYLAQWLQGALAKIVENDPRTLKALKDYIASQGGDQAGG